MPFAKDSTYWNNVDLCTKDPKACFNQHLSEKGVHFDQFWRHICPSSEFLVPGGHQAFFPLARNAAVAAGGLVLSLRTFGSTLSGVWCSFAVFNAIRFAGAFRHHLVTGPLGSRARKAAAH